MQILIIPFFIDQLLPVKLHNETRKLFFLQVMVERELS